MSDWHVSPSESEGEEGEGGKDNERGGLELGGLTIPASRIVELLQAVGKRGTAELDCLSNVRRKRHGHRKKKHRRSHGLGDSPGHGSGVKSTEEVSETTSDVRSTTSTNITECREARRPDFSKFDPSFDPELDDSMGVAAKVTAIPTRKAPPNHLKEKRLASLDKITADTIKSKQRWHQQFQHGGDAPSPVAITTASLTHNSSEAAEVSGADHQTDGAGVFNNDRGRGEDHADEKMEVDGVGESELEHPGMENVELPSFRFDEDEDSDGGINSEADMKLSILSQLNRIENLLDSESLT